MTQLAASGSTSRSTRVPTTMYTEYTSAAPSASTMPSGVPLPPPTVIASPALASSSAPMRAASSRSPRNTAASTATMKGKEYSSRATRLASACFSALKYRNDWPV